MILTRHLRIDNHTDSLRIENTNGMDNIRIAAEQGSN
jgi:hypothetical protein